VGFRIQLNSTSLNHQAVSRQTIRKTQTGGQSAKVDLLIKILDLLITKFHISPHAIDITFGLSVEPSAYSA
jgi:hypothetical protein